MRILHLDTGPSMRGGQQQALFLMQGLRALGQDQRLLAASDSPLAEQAAAQKFPLLPLKLSGLSLIHAAREVRLALAGFRPEVLHFHDARAHGLGQWANRSFHIPAVVSRRVAFPIRRSVFFRWKYLQLQQHFIAVSEYVRRSLIEAGVKRESIHVVYDCVDPSIGPQDHKPGSNGVTGFIVGTAGAFEPEKGHLLLIRALARARPSLPGLRCIIAGEGSQRRQLLRCVHAHKLQDCVSFEPFPLSLPRFMARLDLFVLPSLEEGLGSICLAAMRCGTPVLASAVGGVPEMVRDKQTGFLFSAGDAEGLSDAVILLSMDRKRRESVTAAAQQTVQERFSREMMTTETLKIYENLLRHS